jgi:transcriptional regulator GlxA family with amidase domain
MGHQAHHHMERRNFLRGGAAAVGAGALAATATAGAATATDTAGRATPLRVHIVLFDGLDEMDVIAPYEVFSAASMHAPAGVEARFVTLGEPRTITAGWGTELRAAHRWSPGQADLIVVPGGGFADRDGPGVWAEIDDGALPRALAAAPRPGLTIASVCTGAIVLAAAGLTDGRPCTTHHRAEEELASRGGVLTNARVVDDGDLVTAGGVTSGLELALWLVRREIGSPAAVGIEEMLEYEARGTVWTSS